MRKPALKAEVFLAALAVLTTTACSKRADSGASPDPASMAPSPAPSPPPAEAPIATAAASATGAPTATAVTPQTAAVDAGKEVRPASPKKAGGAGDRAAPAPENAGKGNAACGASGCSPEMKKGNK